MYGPSSARQKIAMHDFHVFFVLCIVHNGLSTHSSLDAF